MKKQNSPLFSMSSGFVWCLAIVFIVLKLCGVIDWAWWVVLTPIWIPFVLLAAICITIVVVMEMTLEDLPPPR